MSGLNRQENGENNYTSHLMKSMYEASKEGKLTDLTLTLKDREVHCHRIVLCLCSQYLDRQCQRGNSKHVVLDAILDDCINPDMLESAIRFVYVGEVDLNEENAPQLCHVAHKLEVDKLRKQCEKFMIHNLSVKNCISWSLQ